MEELIHTIKNAIIFNWQDAQEIPNHLQGPGNAWPAFEFSISNDHPHIVVCYSPSPNQIVIYCQKLNSRDELNRYIEYSKDTTVTKILPDHIQVHIQISIIGENRYECIKPLDWRPIIGKSILEVESFVLKQIINAFEHLEAGQHDE